MCDEYSIEEHKHRLAAWAASTAARASHAYQGFSVEKGRKILQNSGFNSEFSMRNLRFRLSNPSKIDGWHKRKCIRVIKKAQAEGIENFTHGVSAKLINCYLKVRFVCGRYPRIDKPWVDNLHPPIDSILLDGLNNANRTIAKSDILKVCSNQNGQLILNELIIQGVIEEVDNRIVRLSGCFIEHEQFVVNINNGRRIWNVLKRTDDKWRPYNKWRNDNPNYIAWSKLNSDKYEEVIGMIRSLLQGEPLWKIEKYWQGYQ